MCWFGCRDFFFCTPFLKDMIGLRISFKKEGKNSWFFFPEILKDTLRYYQDYYKHIFRILISAPRKGFNYLKGPIYAFS